MIFTTWSCGLRRWWAPTIFFEAETLLAECLKKPWSKQNQVVLFQQLMHVHTASGDLAKAQLAMDAREDLDPSASTALSNAYFQLYGRGEPHVAQSCVRLAIKRASDDDDPFTLYCAHCLAGLLAAREEDWNSAGESLVALRRLANDRKNGDLSWGDAVPFLEAVPRESEDLYQSAIEFASLITPNIEDADFRRRANSVGKQL
jgi:hypothetical protein